MRWCIKSLKTRGTIEKKSTPNHVRETCNGLIASGKISRFPLKSKLSISSIFLSQNVCSVSEEVTQNIVMFFYFFVAFVALLFLYHYIESSRFPPGFPRYPVIGSLLSTGTTVNSGIIVQATSVSKKYGDVIGYFLGPFIR
jgi:hypothetical protein